jgi:hypothetical protein
LPFEPLFLLSAKDEEESKTMEKQRIIRSKDL